MVSLIANKGKEQKEARNNAITTLSDAMLGKAGECDCDVVVKKPDGSTADKSVKLGVSQQTSAEEKGQCVVMVTMQEIHLDLDILDTYEQKDKKVMPWAKRGQRRKKQEKEKVKRK